MDKSYGESSQLQKFYLFLRTITELYITVLSQEPIEHQCRAITVIVWFLVCLLAMYRRILQLLSGNVGSPLNSLSHFTGKFVSTMGPSVFGVLLGFYGPQA